MQAEYRLCVLSQCRMKNKACKELGFGLFGFNSFHTKYSYIWFGTFEYGKIPNCQLDCIGKDDMIPFFLQKNIEASPKSKHVLKPVLKLNTERASELNIKSPKTQHELFWCKAIFRNLPVQKGGGVSLKDTPQRWRRHLCPMDSP